MSDQLNVTRIDMRLTASAQTTKLYDIIDERCIPLNLYNIAYNYEKL